MEALIKYVLLSKSTFPNKLVLSKREKNHYYNIIWLWNSLKAVVVS